MRNLHSVQAHRPPAISVTGGSDRPNHSTFRDWYLGEFLNNPDRDIAQYQREYFVAWDTSRGRYRDMSVVVVRDW
jgi:hypothetical protein